MVIVSLDHQRIRYGRTLSRISWIYGSEMTAPTAGTKLVAYKPPAGSGKRVWIYGFYIDATEGNVYQIGWTSEGAGRTYRFRTGGPGTLHVELTTALNEGIPADIETEVYIAVVNNGTTGSSYIAGLLIGETT